MYSKSKKMCPLGSSVPARRAEPFLPDRRLPAIASSGEAGGSPDRAKKKVILCASVVNLQKREV